MRGWLALAGAAALLTTALGSTAGGAAPARPMLTVVVAGPGRVISKPGGISCPGTCRARFARGSRVTLVAKAAPGGAFEAWRGGCGVSSRCILRLASSRKVKARFRILPVLSVGPNALLARGPIDLLAADGGRVAYVSCEHVVVWMPSSSAVRQVDASNGAPCPPPFSPARIVDLAIAGDRVVYLLHRFGNSPSWILRGARLGTKLTRLTLPTSGGNCCAGGPLTGILGDLAGSGALLVYASWDTAWQGGACCTLIVSEQRIHRIDRDGSEWPVIERQPGPIVPFDVDGGRILAGGENETLLLDATGERLRSFAVRASEGMISGDDLVLLVGGELHHYSASTGALLHVWPFAPAPRSCTPVACELPLQDAARSMVAYVRDGQVRMLRLADGADRVVGAGSAARFTDAGLVYADATRLRHVPFSALRLH